MPLHVQQCRVRPDEPTASTATELAMPGNCRSHRVIGCMLFGPLYHSTEVGRQQALDETLGCPRLTPTVA
jgi:hypothetical protein